MVLLDWPLWNSHVVCQDIVLGPQVWSLDSPTHVAWDPLDTLDNGWLVVNALLSWIDGGGCHETSKGWILLS